MNIVGRTENCAMRIIGMNSLSWGFGSNLSNTAKHNLKAG